MLLQVIHKSKGYFVADLILWLIAHNLPLLIAFYTKDYFENDNPIKIVGIIAFLILLRMIFIIIGARGDIKVQQRWRKLFYTIAYDAVQKGNVDLEADNGRLLNSLNKDVSSISYTTDNCSFMFTYAGNSDKHIC